MARHGFLKAVSGTILFVTLLFAVNSACFPVNAPCGGTLDGTWNASTIDGRPAFNFSLPISGDLFKGGYIVFRTTEVQGNCDNPDVTKGTATAHYRLARSDGTLKKPKDYTGRFEFNHSTNTLKLTAAGYLVNGSVSAGTMTLPVSHALFGSYSLVLTK
jgi:hypothetical protein